MTSPAYSKRKGAQNESDNLNYLRGRDWQVEQLHLRGAKDEGDLVVRLGDYHMVVEAKAEKQFDLAGYVTELHREQANYASARRLQDHLVHGLVLLKRPGKPVRDAYVIRTLADEEALWEEVLAR